MANEIKLPKLGEKLDEATVLAIKVAPGAEVSVGQPVVEVEADKITTDVSAETAGRITQVLVKKGDKVRTGQTLFVLEPRAGKSDDRPKAAATAAAAPAAPVAAAPVPVARPAPAAPAPAPAPAVSTAAPAAPPQRDGARTAPVAAPVPEEKLVPAGPATRRLARELNIDLKLVQGTAKGGRVTQEDVKAYVRRLAQGTVAPRAGGPAPALPDFAQWGEIEARPLDSIRRKTAEQMSLSWSLVPHVTQQDLADVTDLDAFRRERTAKDAKGPKLTMTAFALKAAAIALQQMPQFNASLDLAAQRLLLKRYYHLGVAVDTERGLLVPVLRNVDQKSVYELARELNEIAERARDRKIKLEELQGGTFTLTNLGGIGGTGFSPIVNYPEVAILGLSRARLQPAVHEGQIVPRLQLPLSLSYDHRVIDGADAARFTRRIAELLENPLLMLLHA
jgi:pyruvate dehydrogenase E2 component (dihydrolipoamide acetyltransferase)